LALVGIGVTGAAATALTAAFAGLVFAVVVAVATVAGVVIRRRRAPVNACATAAPGPVQVEFVRRSDHPERAAP
jgi:hypothetical protein